MESQIGNIAKHHISTLYQSPSPISFWKAALLQYSFSLFVLVGDFNVILIIPSIEQVFELTQFDRDPTHVVIGCPI